MIVGIDLLKIRKYTVRFTLEILRLHYVICIVGKESYSGNNTTKISKYDNSATFKEEDVYCR